MYMRNMLLPDLTILLGNVITNPRLEYAMIIWLIQEKISNTNCDVVN